MNTNDKKRIIIWGIVVLVIIIVTFYAIISNGLSDNADRKSVKLTSYEREKYNKQINEEGIFNAIVYCKNDFGSFTEIEKNTLAFLMALRDDPTLNSKLIVEGRRTYIDPLYISTYFDKLFYGENVDLTKDKVEIVVNDNHNEVYKIAKVEKSILEDNYILTVDVVYSSVGGNKTFFDYDIINTHGLKSILDFDVFEYDEAYINASYELELSKKGDNYNLKSLKKLKSKRDGSNYLSITPKVSKTKEEKNFEKYSAFQLECNEIKDNVHMYTSNFIAKSKTHDFPFYTIETSDESDEVEKYDYWVLIGGNEEEDPDFDENNVYKSTSLSWKAIGQEETKYVKYALYNSYTGRFYFEPI